MTMRRNNRQGDVISEREAKEIRRRYDAYEAAREKFNPKRFKRGGGYDAADEAVILEMANIDRRVTNEELALLETYNWINHPPDNAFVYYDEDMHTVRGFMGNKLGDIVWKGDVVRRTGSGRTQNVRVHGTNGAMYAGTCNLSSGTYCRLRRTFEARPKKG